MAAAITETDPELLVMLRMDDRAAFNKIFSRYWSKLYISAYKLLRDRQASEDIVQEVLLQLWVKRHEQLIKNLNNYLYTAIRFQVFKLIRSQKVRVELFEEIEHFGVDPEQALIALDINAQLEKHIAQLPEKCQQIFRLSRQDLLSNQEIADLLGISIKTVEAQLTIARRKLKHSMGELLFWLAVFMLPLWTEANSREKSEHFHLVHNETGNLLKAC